MNASTLLPLSPTNEDMFWRAMCRFACKGYGISLQDDRLHLEASTADFSYDALLAKHSSLNDGEVFLGDFVSAAFDNFVFKTMLSECSGMLKPRRAGELIVCDPHGIECHATYTRADGFELNLRVGCDAGEFVFNRPLYSSWPTAHEIKGRLQTAIKDCTASLLFIAFLKGQELAVSKSFITVIDHRMSVRFENGEPQIDFEEKLSPAALKKASQLLDDFKEYKDNHKPTYVKVEEEPMESDGLDLA